MKRSSYIVFLIILLCIFAGCSSKPADGDASSQGTTVPAVSEVRIVSVTKTGSSYGTGDVCVPQISEESVNADAVNKVIEQELTSILTRICGCEPAEAHFDLDYSVTFNDGTAISFLFEGTLQAEGTAHPSNIAFPLSVSLIENQGIVPQDLLEINDSFLTAFRQQLSTPQMPERYDPQQWEAVADYILSFSDAEIVKILNDREDPAIALDPNGVIVIFPVPHAAGDYVKVFVPVAWQR